MFEALRPADESAHSAGWSTCAVCGRASPVIAVCADLRVCQGAASGTGQALSPIEACIGCGLAPMAEREAPARDRPR